MSPSTEFHNANSAVCKALLVRHDEVGRQQSGDAGRTGTVAIGRSRNEDIVAFVSAHHVGLFLCVAPTHTQAATEHSSTWSKEVVACWLACYVMPNVHKRSDLSTAHRGPI